MPLASMCRFRLRIRPSLGAGVTCKFVSAPCCKPSSEVKSEVRAAESRASWIMRNPAIGVGVPGPVVPAGTVLEPLDKFVPTALDESHVRAAKIPRDIKSNTSAMLAIAMSRRRRFFKALPSVLRTLFQSRQLLLPWLDVGEPGAAPAGAIAGNTRGVPTGAGSGAATVALRLDEIEFIGLVITFPSSASSG